jgi:large subunit ribosomal protein L17
MRHGNKNNNLSRTASHRRALLMNLGCQLITYKRITTTVAKAKALRTYIEPLITKTKATESKEAISHNHRIVFSYLNDKAAVKELFTVVAPKVVGRPGGYTRIIKLGARQGDNAEMAMIELVDFNEIYGKGIGENTTAEPAKKTRRSGGAKAKTSAAETNTDANAIADAEVITETAAPTAKAEVVKETVVETAPAAIAEVVTETPAATVEVVKETVMETAAPVEVVAETIAPVATAEVITETVVETAAPAKATKADDLTIIEGLGPKAAEVLNAAGIVTFLELVATPAEKVKEILTSANARVGHLDPTTWGQQAQLAADGKMDELKELQDKLNNGKEV